jgi:hypothetical protein
MAEEIQNKSEVKKRINELKAKGMWKHECGFCTGNSDDFLIDRILREIDGVKYVRLFCARCGCSLFLDYNVLMGIIKPKGEEDNGKEDKTEA